MKLTVEIMVSLTDDLVILHEGLVAVVPAAQAEAFAKALRTLQAQAKDQVAQNIAQARLQEGRTDKPNGQPRPARTETRPRPPAPVIKRGSNEEKILRVAAELAEPFTVGTLRERLGESEANKNLHAVLYQLSKKQLLDREEDADGKLHYRFSTKGTELMVGTAH